MTISQTASTLVWNRARGLCSICRIDLVDKIGGDPKITGERAHITAASPGGPRYDAELDEQQRNDYGNLILLCGCCHTKIDAAPQHYTVAILHSIKAQHEQYCGDLLTVDDERRAIREEIVANAVDIVVDGLSLERWEEWTARALGPSPYLLPNWWYREFRLVLRPSVEAVLWPNDARSLGIASKMSVDAVRAFYSKFCERTPSDNRELNMMYSAADSIDVMLFRGRSADSAEYERQIFDWDNTLELGLVHATKCVNWFAEAVREHVNPRFRITQGAFCMEPSHFERGKEGVFTFTPDEKARLFERGYVDGTSKDVWGIVGDTWASPPERKYAGEDGRAFSGL